MNIGAFVRGYLKRQYGATPEQIDAFIAYQGNHIPLDAQSLADTLDRDAAVYFGAKW